MNSKDALREFEEMWTPKKRGKGPSTFPQHLHNLISEHYYPKEFVEWAMTDDVVRTEEGLYYFKPTAAMRDLTLDELFNYWEENER